jgi:CBS domain-containing protein
MRVKEIMTPEPYCCAILEPVQNAARMMKDWDVGSLPVVADQHSWKLKGIVTDRDLCCTVLAEGADPATIPVEKVMTRDPATCKPEDDVDSCAKIMQEHQVRRVPVVDDQGHCIGIVAQADLALKGKLRQISETVAEISKPPH